MCASCKACPGARESVGLVLLASWCRKGMPSSESLKAKREHEQLYFSPSNVRKKRRSCVRGRHEPPQQSGAGLIHMTGNPPGSRLSRIRSAPEWHSSRATTVEAGRANSLSGGGTPHPGSTPNIRLEGGGEGGVYLIPFPGFPFCFFVLACSVENRLVCVVANHVRLRTESQFSHTKMKCRYAKLFCHMLYFKLQQRALEPSRMTQTRGKGVCLSEGGGWLSGVPSVCPPGKAKSA